MNDELLHQHLKKYNWSGDKDYQLAFIALKEFQSSCDQQIALEAQTVGGNKVEFSHTAVNRDMHLFIDGYHDPDVCPECIKPGTLVDATFKSKQKKGL